MSVRIVISSRPLQLVDMSIASVHRWDKVLGFPRADEYLPLLLHKSYRKCDFVNVCHSSISQCCIEIIENIVKNESGI